VKACHNPPLDKASKERMEDVITHAQLHERNHPLFKTALNPI